MSMSALSGAAASERATIKAAERLIDTALGTTTQKLTLVRPSRDAPTG
jgi:hypothetical protein